jgi:type IV pilus assembly protein PilV
MATTNNPVARKAQRGTTLIETMVALLVLSVGLLGVAALQLTSLRNNRGAHLRSQAQVMAYDIADRMRANRNVALTNGYNIALGATPSASDPLALLDLQRWRESVSTTLPAGDGSVAIVGGTNVVVITIRWADTTTGGAAAPPETFTTRTQI